MANPIKPTPTLYGEDGEHFLKTIEEPPTPEAIEFVKEILEDMGKYEPFIKIDEKIHTNHRKQK